MQMKVGMSPLLDARRKTRYCSHARLTLTAQWFVCRPTRPTSRRRLLSRVNVNRLASPEWKCTFLHSCLPRRSWLPVLSRHNFARSGFEERYLVFCQLRRNLVGFASRLGNVFLDNLVTEVNLLLKSRWRA